MERVTTRDTEYLSIDIEVVWDIVENYLPPLENAIEAISQQFWD